MKKKLFSRGLYVESLKQLRVTGFVFAAVMLLIQISVPVIQLINYNSVMENLNLTPYEYGVSYSGYPQAVGFIDYFPAIIPITFIAAPLMVLVCFSVFNKRSSSDFYHSLPYTRTCIFLSFLAAIFTWIAAMSVVSGGIGLGLHLAMKNVFAVSFSGFFDILFSYFAMTLVIVASLVLAMSVTGTLFSNITVAALIFGLPRLLISIFTYAVTDKLTYVSSEYFAPVLSLRYNVTLSYIISGLDGNQPDALLRGNLPCDIYTIAVAALMFVLALVAFNHRKSEMASQPAPGSRTQAVIRCALALALSIVATAFLIAGTMDACSAVIIYALAVIVYFSYELLSTLKWKNLTRIFPGLIAVVALNLVCAGLVFAFVSGAASYSPAADEIRSVRFVPSTRSSDGGYSETDFAEKGAENIAISDDGVSEIVSSALKRCIAENGIYNENHSVLSSRLPDVTRVVAISAGGAVRYRSITFTAEENESLMNRLSENADYEKAYLTLPKRLSGTESLDYVNFGGYSEAEYDKLFESLQSEVYGVGLADWSYILGNNYGREGMTFIMQYTPEDLSYDTVSVPISAQYTPKTYDLVLGMITESQGSASEETAMEILTGGINTANLNELYFEVQVFDNRDGGDIKSWQAYYNYYSDDQDGEKSAYNTADSYVDENMISYPSDALAALAEGISASDKPISHEGYVTVNFRIIEKNSFDEYGYTVSEEATVYLPLPNSFNPDDLEGFNRIG